MEEGALLQERHVKAVATERELRESLASAERRGDVLARETAELKQHVAGLNGDLSIAEERAVAAAAAAAKELEAEREKTAELLHVVRTKRGFLGMFRKTPKAAALAEHDEARRSARRGRRALALPAPPATAPPAFRATVVEPAGEFEFRTTAADRRDLRRRDGRERRRRERRAGASHDAGRRVDQHPASQARGRPRPRQRQHPRGVDHQETACVRRGGDLRGGDRRARLPARAGMPPDVII